MSWCFANAQLTKATNNSQQQPTANCGYDHALLGGDLLVDFRGGSSRIQYGMRRLPHSVPQRFQSPVGGYDRWLALESRILTQRAIAVFLQSTNIEVLEMPESSPAVVLPRVVL